MNFKKDDGDLEERNQKKKMMSQNLKKIRDRKINSFKYAKRL